jgi:serine/threonine protein kinase
MVTLGNETGQDIGPYRILEYIGGGGFGTVYMAKHKVKRSVVAIKILKPELCRRSDFRERFEEEAQLLRSLPIHPNIVTLQNYGYVNAFSDHLEDSLPYLVMEYLAGSDLRTILEDGSLSVQRSIGIIRQVAEALAHAADGGVIHCDIKPENLQIAENDQVKVLDFGIARAADAGYRQTAGTPAYIAPEIWRGEQPSYAADIYSLGCVFYECLVGAQPFSGTRNEVRDCHLNFEPDWLPFQTPDFPVQILELLKNLFSKFPVDRFSSQEISDILAKIESTIDPKLKLATSNDIKVNTRPIEDSDETLNHIEGEGEEDEITLDRLLELTNDPISRSTPSTDLEQLPTHVKFHIQRHLGTVDLQTQACRSAIIHNGCLITGAINGQVWSLDLSSGRQKRWTLPSLGLIKSSNWVFIGDEDHLIVYVGGQSWVEVEIENGQETRSGFLPESGMSMIQHRDGLYLWGRGNKLYRTPLHNMGKMDEFQINCRLTGVPLINQEQIFLPTPNGLLCFNSATMNSQTIGPAQNVRSVSKLPSDRLAVSYSTVSQNGIQILSIRILPSNLSTPTVLAEVEFTGQPAGSLLNAGNNIFQACRDGRIFAWEVQEIPQGIELKQKFSRSICKDLGLQSNACLGGGLLILAPSKNNSGVICFLNAETGETVHEQSLQGDVSISPLWWQNILSIILVEGKIETYRVTTMSTGD